MWSEHWFTWDWRCWWSQWAAPRPWRSSPPSPSSWRQLPSQLCRSGRCQSAWTPEHRWENCKMASLQIQYFDNWLTGVALEWWDQAPEASHSLQAATTLDTSSAEPPTSIGQTISNFPYWTNSQQQPWCWWWRRPSTRPGRPGWRQWGGRCGWSGQTLQRSARSPQSCLPPGGCSGPSGRWQQTPWKKIGWHTLHRRNLCASMESVEMATMGHSLPSSEEASALRKLADTGRKSPWTSNFSFLRTWRMIRIGLGQGPHRRRAPSRARWGRWSRSPRSGRPSRPGQWSWAQDLQAASFKLLQLGFLLLEIWQPSSPKVRHALTDVWLSNIPLPSWARICLRLRLHLLHIFDFGFV